MIRAAASPAIKAIHRQGICPASLRAPRRYIAAAAGGELNTSTNGMKWKDVEEGTGPSPEQGTKISAHYTGRLTDGTKFDSSVDRGQPLQFFVGVGQVIKMPHYVAMAKCRGWDVGILGSEADGIPPMREGGKRLLVIPPDMAYGARGAGGVIPPNATLEFDVELVKATA